MFELLVVHYPTYKVPYSTYITHFCGLIFRGWLSKSEMKERSDIPFYFSWWQSKQGISSSLFLVHQYGKKFLSFYDTCAYYYEEEKIATVKARLRLVISLHIKSVSTKILKLLGNTMW